MAIAKRPGDGGFRPEGGRVQATLHAHAIEVDSRLRTSIEQQMAEAVGEWGPRVGHVHVRLYGEVGEPTLCTCFVRVDLLPNGGVALGDSATDPARAIALTAARIGAAVARGERWRAARSFLGRFLPSTLDFYGAMAQGGELAAGVNGCRSPRSAL